MRINPFPAQVLLTAFACLVTGMMSFPVRADDVFMLPQHEFFKAQCGDCHTGKEAEAGFRLSDLNGSMEVPGNYDRWVQVLDRVAAGEMPPTDSSNVSEGDRQVFVKEISGWLSERREKEFAEYGRVRGRRLSNYQLERSLQDLLGIEVPLQVHFPEETQSKWFSTVAGAQAMSHFQLERHLYVVDLALDSAFEKALRDPKLESRLLDAETLSRSNPKRRCREPELIDNFAVTWCSGLVFYGRIPATTAPEDGWYRFVVRAKSLKQPENSGVWCTVRTGHHVSGSPIQNWVGAFEATPEVQEWTYETWLDKGKMLEIRPGDDTLKRARFDGGQVGTGEGEPQNVPGVAIESIEMTPIFPLTTRKQTRQLLIDDLSIRWDKETKSFTLLSDQPQEDLARLMTRFAERAFRRPVTDEEVKPFLEMAQASYAEDNNLLQAVRIGYRALLCSPRFLYFNEKPGQLDDYEIASRLSYFLWNSIPDEALLAQAAAGKLHQPATLKAELNRMLDQPRARDFVRQLANEWLDLKLIDFTEPDSRLYPGFDVVVQQSMVEETVAFLQEMLHENRSVSEMIDADHTYLNSRLARFYRIEGVTGDDLVRVKTSEGDHRGGLVTQGAILKVTANGTTTSPVIRGIWVSERILGVPIPDPPMGVPAIEPDIRGATTIREILAKHKSDASCAGCHVKIDPPGFALENFDPSGRWRDNYGGSRRKDKSKGLEIDTSSEFPDGRTFQTFEDFQKLIASQPESLARNCAEKLMMYGTGAPIDFVDRDEINQIVAATAQDQYGFKSILEQVVLSPLFTTK